MLCLLHLSLWHDFLVHGGLWNCCGFRQINVRPSTTLAMIIFSGLSVPIRLSLSSAKYNPHINSSKIWVYNNIYQTRNLTSHMTCASHTGNSSTWPQQHTSLAAMRLRWFLYPWTFDLLTSRSMHAKPLTQSICVHSLVMIAQDIFFKVQTDTHRPTHKVTDAIHHLIPCICYAVHMLPPNVRGRSTYRQPL